MSELTVMEIEAAINYWRARCPSTGDDLKLCREANALSLPYAQMIYERRNVLDINELSATAHEALIAWQATVPGRN